MMRVGRISGASVGSEHALARFWAPRGLRGSSRAFRRESAAVERSERTLEDMSG